MQPWALVAPASRGIGMEFARRLLQTTKVPVVATARKDLDQTRENVLKGLNDVSEDRLKVVRVDVIGRIPRIPQIWTSLIVWHRRAINIGCSRASLEAVSEEGSLPSPLTLYPRHPLPGESAISNQLRRCAAHVQDQYTGPDDADQALLTLPSSQVSKFIRRVWSPSTCHVDEHERSSWVDQRQWTRRMVLVQSVKSCSQPDYEDV